MQEFKHVNAKTFEEASRELADGRKVDNLAMAGGTDLMTELRTRIQPVYPDKIVNLKSIEGAEYIEGEDSVKIGALTKLKDALKGTDTEAIKAASAELGEVFQTISARVYQETGADPTGAAGAAGGAAGGQDNVYDADYEVVDDDQQ